MGPLVASERLRLAASFQMVAVAVTRGLPVLPESLYGSFLRLQVDCSDGLSAAGWVSMDQGLVQALLSAKSIPSPPALQLGRFTG